MNKMYELRDMLCEKLDEYAGEGKLTMASLEAIHKLTDTIKNISKIEMLDEAGYSNDYCNDYSNDRSNRYSGRRRDSMGRYARESRSSYRYSRDDATSHMASEIEQMIGEATDDRKREALRRCLSELRSN